MASFDGLINMPGKVDRADARSRRPLNAAVAMGSTPECAFVALGAAVLGARELLQLPGQQTHILTQNIAPFHTSLAYDVRGYQSQLVGHRLRLLASRIS